MDSGQTCPECGVVLPANAPQGLCPRCLAGAGLSLLSTETLPKSDSQIERTGTMIGRYKLLEKIGEGGFGVVYMAEQVEPVQRKVALKIIKAGMDTREVIARFEAERQAIALMDHPNIARALDAGATDAGRPYFVMELVRGIPITDYCDQANLPTRERLQLFMKVCQAVQHAHQKGVIHRDIKPTNVLVTEHDGEPVPKVIDFGVAKALGQKLTEKTLFTGFQHMIGTPAYMSPEQAALSGLDIDTRADIYSLGVLLYELLTGVTPFDAETFRKSALDEVRRMIRESEPPRPSTRLQTLGDKLPCVARHRQTEAPKLVHQVRGDLDWIVMKCLEKDRRRRYATANGLAADVMRHLGSEPVVARPPSSLYRFQKLIRRHKVAFAAASTVAAALLSGFSVSTWLFVHEKRALRVATQAEAQTKQAQQQTREQLYESYLVQARANRLTARAGRRFESLETIRKAAAIRPSPELRDEAIAAWALLDVRVAKKWELPQVTEPDGILFDPKLEHYAVEKPDGNISVRRVADNYELSVVPCRDLHLKWLYSFSPDGRYLTMDTWTAKYCVWDIPHGEWALRCLEGFQGFNPKGVSFACANTNGTLSLYDLDSRRETRQLEVRAGPACFDPGGSRLASFNATTSSVELWDLESKKVAVKASVPDECDAMAWSADGRFLAAGCADNCVYILDGQTGARVALLKGHQLRVTRLAFNHAGNLLATTSWDGSIRLWDPIRELPLLAFQDGAGTQLQFSEDDRQLAYFVRKGREFGLLEVATSPVYRRLAISDPRGDCHALDLSPDGRLIVVGVHERLCFLDFASGREIGFLLHSNCASALFHPDGKSLLTSGNSGLMRMAITRARRDQAEELCFGSPRAMSPEVSNRPMWFASQSGDGGTVAATVQAAGGVAVVLNTSGPTNVVSLTHPGAAFVTVSPDGKWVATGTWKGTDVKIWEAATGNWEHTLDLPTSEQVRFSPDGNWLFTAGQHADCQLWEVGSWRLRFAIPEGSSDPIFAAIAFSPDSRLLALGQTSDDVQFFETTTGHLIARIAAPDRFKPSALCFSKDGSQLLALDTVNNVHVWDLRTLRQLLKSMNLDWDMPPYSPQEKATQLKPLQTQVITSDAK